MDDFIDLGNDSLSVTIGIPLNRLVDIYRRCNTLFESMITVTARNDTILAIEKLLESRDFSLREKGFIIELTYDKYFRTLMAFMESEMESEGQEPERKSIN